MASDNDDLNIKGYIAHIEQTTPNNVRKGGVCAYIKESLLVRCLSNTYLQECLLLKRQKKIQKELYCFTVSNP